VRIGEEASAVATKAGDLVDAAIALALVPGPTYASRGGDKLAGALDALLRVDAAVDPHGRTCLDVGA
jgi:predicted rRNA methylase YqxC with S4 and FtsJ domains